jgi:hypothetical protein
MIDMFTRWLIVVPIPNRSAAVIGYAIYKHLICEKSIPRRILSDRAKEFIDRGVKDMCHRWGIAKMETSGLQPQSCGHIERAHRYLNASLTMLYNKLKNDWVYNVPAVVFAYRISPSSATGYSPFYLEKGRHPNVPAERLLKLDLDRPVYSSEREWVKDLSRSLRESYKMVRETQDKEDAKSLARRNKCAQKPVYYEPGNMVYLWEDVTDLRPDDNGMRKVPSKLSYKWSGPHKVLTTVRNNCCKIQHYDKRFKESIKIMNVNRLARCHQWDDRIGQTDAEEEEPTSGPIRVRGEPNKGELMAFKYEGEPNTPFGIGKFKSMYPAERDSEGKMQGPWYNFDWYGNYHHRPEGVYREGWINNARKTWYFKDAPDKKDTATHVRMTSASTKTWITKKELLCFGFKLTQDGKPSQAALRYLSKHDDVPWSQSPRE